MANFYEATVPSILYPTIDSAIVDILSSGLQTYDVARIIVNGGDYSGTGSYFIPSGSLFITATQTTNVDTMLFHTSGNIQLENFNISELSASGRGFINLIGISGDYVSVSGCGGFGIDGGTIGSSLTAVGIEGTTCKSLNADGDIQILFRDITNLDIISGNYSNGLTEPKVTFQLCSGIVMQQVMAANASGDMLLFQGCPDINIRHVTLASNVSGYAIAKFESLNSINCSGNIDYSILVGNIGSGMGPLARSNTNQMIVSNTSCLYNFNDNESYTGISGYYFNRNPLFVNAVSGDLRPDVNSPCASSAEELDLIENFGDVTIETTELNKEAIKFSIYRQNINAVKPSGMYIIGSGLAVFFQSDSSLDNEMDVTINKQYKMYASGKTFQSYSNQVDVKGYDKDYKLIPYTDYASNQMQYYVEPFTILSFEEVLEKSGASFQSIEISGKYKFHGFTRDRYLDVNGNPLYWVGEEYNSYLYGYSILNNSRIVTYPLFPASGMSSVTLYDVPYISKTNGYANIYSDKVYVDDHYESRNIPFQNVDGIFKFKSFEKDTTLKISALGTIGDYLTVLGREEHRDDTKPVSVKHNLHFFNKFEKHPFVKSTVMFSGLALLDNVTVGDMTFNDMGNLLISVSGVINQYKFYYDYALLTRSQGAMKSTLLFREKYNNGVNL